MLSPYQFRPLSPPGAGEVPSLVSGVDETPGWSDCSYRSCRSTPEFQDIQDHPPTPLDRSPSFFGPTLIPKLRTQDLEPVAPVNFIPGRRGHKRAVSQGLVAPTPFSYAQSRPGFSRSTTTPPRTSQACSLLENVTPISAVSTVWSNAPNSSINSTFDSVFSSPINPFTQYPQFQRRSQGHNRSVSESSIYNTNTNYNTTAASTINNYLPNYAYINYTQLAPQSSFYWAPTLDTLSDEITPIAPSAAASFEDLSYPDISEPTSTMSKYLTSANPVIQLCRNQPLPIAPHQRRHFWWDVRNLREWSTFNLATIKSIPGFANLLNIPVPASGLVEPLILPSRCKPVDATALKLLVKEFFAAKINATMPICQSSQRHMTMRACREQDAADFISQYEDSANSNAMPTCGQMMGGGGLDGFGGLAGKTRLVGVVKSFNTWNSQMRAGSGPEKVKYLDGLAHLQRCMRDASVRYGYLITETELVCVRLGTEDTPFFGLLELSPSIRLTEHRDSNEDGAGDADEDKPVLTACQALWYMHMLAKETPPHGQCKCKVHVGLPGELTRKKVVDGGADKWIPPVQDKEKRDAKRLRGWALPADKFNRVREGGIMKKR